jgi:hypothetical protein
VDASLILAEIHHLPAGYPGEFVHAQKNQRNVRLVIKAKYPGPPGTLPDLGTSEHAILRVPTPNLELRGPNHPPYMLLRFDNIVLPAHRSKILAAWDTLQSTHPRHHLKRERSRSTTPAYHFGVWEVSLPDPLITSETRIQCQEAVVAIDNLLLQIQRYVAPKIKSLLKRHLPNQWDNQDRCVVSYGARRRLTQSSQGAFPSHGLARQRN